MKTEYIIIFVIIFIILIISTILILYFRQNNQKLYGGTSYTIPFEISILHLSPDIYVKLIYPYIFRNDKYEKVNCYIDTSTDKYFDITDENTKKIIYNFMLDINNEVEPNSKWEKLSCDYALRYNKVLYIIEFDVHHSKRMMKPTRFYFSKIKSQSNPRFGRSFAPCEDNNHHTDFNIKLYHKKFKLYNILSYYKIC